MIKGNMLTKFFTLFYSLLNLDQTNQSNERIHHGLADSLLGRKLLTLLGIGLLIPVLMTFTLTSLYAQDDPLPVEPVDLSNRQDEIIGGEPAQPNEWPWQALIRFGPYMCSGTLIHQQWVLTAAHCALDNQDNTFPPTSVFVRLGEHDRSKDDGTEQDIAVKAILIHPYYDGNRYDNDLALLRLETPARLNSGVQIIHPMTESVAIDDDALPLFATVTGWGRTAEDGQLSDQLMEVQVPIISNELCNVSYGIITETMLCAGYENGGYDACQGDSGGPLVLPEGEDQWRIAGVVSFGFGCARPQFYGVYTRVSSFTEWLEEKIGPSLWQEATNQLPLPDKELEEKSTLTVLGSVNAETGATLQIQEEIGNTTTLTVISGSVLTTTLLQLNIYTTTETVAEYQKLMNKGFTLSASQSGVIDKDVHFEQPVTVSIDYAESDVALLEEADLTLLRNETADGRWRSQGSTFVTHDAEKNQIIFTITKTGTYLLGTQESQLFLPIVSK